MTVRGVAAVMLCAVAVLAAACGGISDPSTNTKEDFSGTLSPGTSTFFTFSVGKVGEVTVTITKESFTTNVALGLYLSQPAGGICDTNTPYINNFSLLNQTALTVPQLSKGTYCVGVYDPGGGHVPSPVTFTITVQHP
jgi:hypothetical protein